MAAGVVRPAVCPTHGALLAAPADVLAGAGAQRQALHILHAYLELGTLHLLARAPLSLDAGDERMGLVFRTGADGAASTMVFNRLPLTVVKFWTPRLLTHIALDRDGLSPRHQ